MMDSSLPDVDGIGPEAVVLVADPETGMRGVLVVDCSLLGPAGGGIRMLPDITVKEVAALARAMTYKYGILGFPRGGCKAGIWGEPGMSGEQRRGIMRAFGRALKPYLAAKAATVGPDMGIGVEDLVQIYDAAGVEYPRSGLFNQLVEGYPLEFHITGHGVIVAARTAFEVAGLDFARAKVAIEGFGHVGVGAARYAVKHGATLVAISTIEGAVYDEKGLDLERLLALRRQCGDACVRAYEGAQQIPNTEIYYLPVDLLVPGARPHVITERNVDKIKAKVISSGSNIPITDGAELRLTQRGILSVPDFIANGGGVIASWVDYLGGNVDQAFRANESLISRVVKEVLPEAIRRRMPPRIVAAEIVAGRVDAARGQPQKSFDQVRQEIRSRLGVFDADAISAR